MSCAKVISHFDVFPAGELGRRRAWSAAEKIRIVEESYRGHRQGSVVARRYGISRPLLTQWRRAYRRGLLGGEHPVFTPVEISPDLRERPWEAPAPQRTGADERVAIMLTNGRRLIVGTSIDATSLTRLVQVLERV